MKKIIDALPDLEKAIYYAVKDGYKIPREISPYIAQNYPNLSVNEDEIDRACQSLVNKDILRNLTTQGTDLRPNRLE